MTSFPVRRAIAAALLAGGLLVLAGVLFSTALANGDTTADNHQTLREHPGLAQAGDLLLHFGWVLLAPAAFGLAALAWRDGGWTVRAGAVLAILGMTTIPGLMVTEAYELVLARDVGGETAVRLSEDAAGEPLAAIITGTAVAGTALGLLLLLAGAWRAGLAPWAAPALLLAGFLAPLAGTPVAGGIGAALTACGLWVAAVALLRSPGRVTALA